MTEKSSTSIRAATLDDLHVLIPLFDSYRQFYGQPSDERLAGRFLRERLERKESVILIAWQAEALGFVQLFPSFSSLSAARIFILNDLFVAPSARRKRVGTLLIRAAAAFATTTGAVRLTLATEITNVTAQALYESEGWVRDSNFYTYNLRLA